MRKYPLLSVVAFPLIDNPSCCCCTPLLGSNLRQITQEIDANSDRKKNGDMDGYVGFHAAVRCSYSNFIHDLSKQCKQLVLHHFDSVTSPYSQVCYEYDLGFSGASTNSVYRYNQLPTAIFFLDLSDGGTFQDENLDIDQENMPPKDQQHTTPGKGTDSKEILRESQLTVPETPSPDQPSDASLGGKKKENGMDIGARKRHARLVANGKNSDMIRNQNGGLLFGDLGSKSVSSSSDIYFIAAQYFARIREFLIERNVPSALKPWIPNSMQGETGRGACTGSVCGK